MHDALCAFKAQKLLFESMALARVRSGSLDEQIIA
jgi:hypothetical protein